MKGLYLLLAIILLHDIFAPHPFSPTVTLSCGNLSVEARDDGHPSAAGFVEDDENTSVPNWRGALIPALTVNFSVTPHPFFHQLLLITKDERPPEIYHSFSSSS